MDNIIGFVIGFIVGGLLLIYVTRSIFSINAFLRHTKIQTDLLTLIAKKLGCDNEEIANALKPEIYDLTQKEFYRKP